MQHWEESELLLSGPLYSRDGQSQPPHSLLILQLWSKSKQQSGLYHIINWRGLSLISIFQGLQGRMLLSSLWFWQGSGERTWTFFRPVWEGRTNTVHLKCHQTSQSWCETVWALPRPWMPRQSSDGGHILLFWIHGFDWNAVGRERAASTCISDAWPALSSSVQSKAWVLHRLGYFNQADCTILHLYKWDQSGKADESKRSSTTVIHTSQSTRICQIKASERFLSA